MGSVTSAMMDVYGDQKWYRYITANIVTTTTKLAEIWNERRLDTRHRGACVEPRMSASDGLLGARVQGTNKLRDL